MHVELSFPLHGTSLMVDHGYSLFSAVAEHVSKLHPSNRTAPPPRPHMSEDPWDHVAILPIGGRVTGVRQLLLTAQSRLTLRLAPKLIPELLPLAGRELRIRGDRVRLGVPNVRALTSESALYARLVTIKGYMTAEPFLEAVKEQLAEIAISGTPRLVPRQAQQVVAVGEHAEERAFTSETTTAPVAAGTELHRPPADPYIRRTIRIRKAEVVGYALLVEGLSVEDSLRLQQYGLGGRRRMGCGVFVPARTEATHESA